MLNYLFRRVLWAVFLLLAVTAITFVIFRMIPQDPAFLILGRGVATNPREAERIRHVLGVDRPVYVQYADYVWNIVRHGSLGQTYASVRAGREAEVRDIIERAAPVTISLVGGGLVIWLLISIPVGILAALRPRSKLDRLLLALVVVGISIHPIAVATTFKYLFGFSWQIAPIDSYCTMFGHGGQGGCGGVYSWFTHLILPWLAFALLFIALYSRMVRASVMEVLGEPYVRTARAKGMTEFRLLRSHVLRTALLPLVTMVGMDLGLAVGNAVYIEAVFHLPGLGALVWGSLIQSEGFELPVISGVVVTVSFAVVFFNLLVDLVYAWVDPRIRAAY